MTTPYDPAGPPEQDPQHGQHPYGQSPYGVDPYAQNPYAQSPYAQSPYGVDPYAQNPYAQSPYGVNPYGQNPYGQPPQQSMPPQQPEGTLPDPKDRYSRGIWRQPDSRPGRFLWWDLLPVLPYLVLIVGVNIVSLVLFGPVQEISLSPEEARFEFLLSGLTFGALTVLILAVAGRALWRSLVVFTHHALAWLKIFLVPALWLTIILTNVMLMALIVTLTGVEPDVSANQAGIEAMIQSVPFWAALLVLGVCGPLVEEYIFRHLLIGKLSRYVNIWICAVISIVPFAFLHVSSELFAGNMLAVLMTVVPYLTMSIMFTLVYIFSGRSLLFVWLVHAFNNCMAVTLQYWLSPLLEDFEEFDPLGVVAAAARALAGPLGLA